MGLSSIICNPYGNFIENTVILILSIEFNHERSVRTNFQRPGTDVIPISSDFINSLSGCDRMTGITRNLSSHNNFVTRKILLVNVIKCHVKRRKNELIYTD